MSMEEEKELIERAKKDPESFSILYDKHYSRIFSYILKRTADVEVAQDVTSETFLKAFKNIRSFKWKGIPFSSWLYRIASNEIASFYRKRKKVISLENISDPKAESNPLDEVIRAQEEIDKHRDIVVLHEKISQLPPQYQEVICLRFFEKKKIQEICEITGKKEGTVKSLLHRAIERLKKLF